MDEYRAELKVIRIKWLKPEFRAAGDLIRQLAMFGAHAVHLEARWASGKQSITV